MNNIRIRKFGFGGAGALLKVTTVAKGDKMEKKVAVILKIRQICWRQRIILL